MIEAIFSDSLIRRIAYWSLKFDCSAFQHLRYGLKKIRDNGVSMENDNVRLDSLFSVSHMSSGHYGVGPSKKPEMVVMGTRSMGLSAVPRWHGICAGVAGNTPHRSSLYFSCLSAMQVPADTKGLEGRRLSAMWHW